MYKITGTLLLTGTIVFGGYGNKTALKPGHPNIILILTDDQGWGDLGISGNTNIETPNIDRLAKTGVTFDRFFVSPVCSPTRAELLTGRYHPRCGVYSTSSGGERLDLDEATIAEYFKSAGYATAAYGKWHNGMQPPYHPNARGFDDFYGFCSGHWGNYFSPMLEHNGMIVTGNGYLADDFTERGIDFIIKNQGRPFFLYLPYNTPHSPMQVPDKWWNKFKNRELKMLHREPEKEDIPFTRAALAMCENIDWNIGRIFSKVEELGLSRNTIFVYLSDNGPNGWRWNGGMKGRKGSVDEGGVRVPMLIKWEGRLPAGKKVTEIAGAIDLLPTLADLAGITVQQEKSLDGVSLKPLLSDDKAKWEERLIFSHWNGQVSVRDNRYRLDNRNHLFDMLSDPGQTVNVAGSFPDITRQLVKAKLEWQAEVLAELPDSDTRCFPIGHSDYPFTHLPARDATASGHIKRSNKFPNDSFFTNWTSTSDSIVWEAEVLTEGEYEVEIYYTCPAEEVGSVVELCFQGEKLTARITKAHNPPLSGMGNDRIPRMESYTKPFIPLNAGTIHLNKGKGLLTLKASEIPGSEVMDFRLLLLKRH